MSGSLIPKNEYVKVGLKVNSGSTHHLYGWLTSSYHGASESIHLKNDLQDSVASIVVPGENVAYVMCIKL
jgi:hypothetical protein